LLQSQVHDIGVGPGRAVFGRVALNRELHLQVIAAKEIGGAGDGTFPLGCPCIGAHPLYAGEHLQVLSEHHVVALDHPLPEPRAAVGDQSRASGNPDQWVATQLAPTGENC